MKTEEMSLQLSLENGQGLSMGSSLHRPGTVNENVHPDNKHIKNIQYLGIFSAFDSVLISIFMYLISSD